MQVAVVVVQPSVAGMEYLEDLVELVVEAQVIILLEAMELLLQQTLVVAVVVVLTMVMVVQAVQVS